ncbi:MAG: hypothetical protein MJ238_00165 [Bacilli bacterium]|nr:hypothetical protein [Bacilli bacterium]
MTFNKSKFALIVSSICSFGLLLSSGFAAAWFISQDNIDVPADGLTGSVLQKYFHSGDGSEDDPFTITRPKHYENMVLLHYNLPGFAEKKYHFSFGADINGDGKIQVYNYSNGKYDPSNGGVSTVLDCTGTEVLPPLGSEDLPFNSVISGNNITISSFKISAKKDDKFFSDIGIFGYVDEGTCSNAYFKNFEIETSYGRYTTSESHFHNDSAVHFGYIAGHIEDASNFTNVYVNDCTLMGSTTNKQINNYGYYGKATKDSLGGSFGQGNDYQFTLNSQAVFNYFDNTYDSINDQQLVLRNVRQTENLEANDNGDKVQRQIKTGTQNIIEPFSSSVKPSSNVVGTTYDLQDGYSLSTIGYATPEYVEARHDYNVYYEDREYIELDGDDHSHDGAIKMPATQPSYVTESMIGSGEGLIVNPETKQEAPTAYYYKNNDPDDPNYNCYFYGESYDRQVINGYDNYDFDVLCKIPNFTTQERKWFAPDLNITGYIFNNKKKIPLDITYKSEALSAGASLAGRYYECTFTVQPVQRKLQEGYHKFSIYISYQYTAWGTSYTHTFVYGNYNSDNNTLDQVEVLVNDVNSGLVVPSVKTNVQNKTEFKEIDNDIPEENFLTHKFDFEENKDRLMPHVDVRSFESKLLYKEVFDGVESADFVVIDETDIKYTNFTYSVDINSGNPLWRLSLISRDPIQGADDVNYFIGEETIVYESGYRSKNIDVVGDGAQFYYQELFGQQIAIIGLDSERSAGDKVSLINETDVGDHFYANERCPSSIVLFIKNTANPLDSRDDAMGKIAFTYVQAKILGYSSDIVEPTFKKRDGFMKIKETGTESDGNGIIQLTNTISLDLNEEYIKKASYCALDSEGRILGRYASDGSTEMSREDQLKIDTYVMCLGGQSNNGYQTWVTNIDFEFKAKDGFGGTFGTVGYRDYPQTIDNTILNFFFETLAVSFQYKIKVSYVAFEEGESSTYIGKYLIDCYADTNTTLKIYNYYSGFYQVFIKTSNLNDYVEVTEASSTREIPASSIQ